MGTNSNKQLDSIMPSILFVCSANQFRSPIAAAVFENKIRSSNDSNQWIVKSAGTWVDNPGPAHPLAIKEAQKISLDLSTHVTQEVSQELFSNADLIIVMTKSQKEVLQYEFSQQKGKILMLSELSENCENDIPDPAENNFADYDVIFADLCKEVEMAFYEIEKRTSKKI